MKLKSDVYDASRLVHGGSGKSAATNDMQETIH